MIRLTKDNFKEEVFDSAQPVLVDFWATWCGPCKMIAPVLEEIDAELPALKIGKVNVDEENALAAAFGISSIPTLILFKDGKAEKAIVGYRTKADLLKDIGEI
ncbi:MAG: thioredoxin [Oscillospiraceae bacterium]|nr:thioredoxin [Oscillospiraceae bacterium]